MAVVKLTKPLEHDGKTYEEIALDLAKLTGQHILKCEREAVIAAGGAPHVEPALDVNFQGYIAAEACGLPVDVLRKLPARDFMNIAREVRDFFLGSD